MSNTARDREDDVIDSFLKHLHRSGPDARLVERPDRLQEAQRRLPAVTTDALIEVPSDGEAPDLWALDVTALALPSTWHPALRALDQRFTAVARNHQVAIRGEGTLPPAQKAAALARACSDAISSQGTTGSVMLGEDLEVRWEPAPDCADEERVGVVFLMPTRSPLLSDQVADTLGPTLTKKVTGQGRRAQASGARYVLLLDWAGDDGIAQGTHWLPQSPETVRVAVHDVLEALDQAPDAIFLWDREGQWHLMKGFDR